MSGVQVGQFRNQTLFLIRVGFSLDTDKEMKISLLSESKHLIFKTFVLYLLHQLMQLIRIYKAISLEPQAFSPHNKKNKKTIQMSL